MLKMFFSFFMPGGLVLFTALIVLGKGYLDPWIHQAVDLLPYAVLGVGFMLGLRFHRSRSAFAVLLLIFADRLIHYFGPGGVVGSGYETTILNTIAILLPLNIILLYPARDRGVLNPAGLFRLCFILLQPVIVFILLRKKPGYFDYLYQEIVPHPFLDKFEVPHSVLFIYGFSILLFLILSLFSKRAILRGFFWALLASAVAFYQIYTGAQFTIYFSVAGFIIILSVLERVYNMAYHDELTSLPARRSLNASLQNLGKNYTIAMLDIDFFKKFNDRYGHDVGDQVLCMVASHLNRVGGGGKPYRYGGEEFTIIFPSKSKKETRPFLESLRESIAGAQFKVRGKKRPRKAPKKKTRAKNPKTVSVTISIGAAEPSRDLSKPAEVMKAADKALYRAKRKGRNCTVS
jgi:diguanylate cyclase (GGDEF)-like protein